MSLLLAFPIGWVVGTVGARLQHGFWLTPRRIASLWRD